MSSSCYVCQFGDVSQLFPHLYFRCTMRVARWSYSWANFTVLEDCTLLMWRRRTLEFDFDLALTRSLLISSYSMIASGVGGEFWWFSVL